MTGKKKLELAGAAYILGGVYLAISLVTYSRWDPSFSASGTFGTKNLGGIAGSYLADALFALIGPAALFLPAFMLISGARRFLGSEKYKIHLVGAVLFIFSFSVTSGMTRLVYIPTGWYAGGFAGMKVSGFLVAFLSVTGGFIMAALLLVSSVILLSPVPIADLIKRERKRPAPLELRQPQTQKTPSAPALFEDAAQPKAEPFLFSGGENAEEIEPTISGPVLNTAPAEKPAARPAYAVNKGNIERPEKTGGYELPPIDLLAEPDAQVERPSREELLAGSVLLERKLRDFGIQGKVAQVHAGPVVTMHEFEPAPGVKIQKVVSLAEDLSLSMKAQSTRIAPIPGKAAIGIEIPNRQRETVLLRDIISSDGFANSASKITLCLGKDIFGNSVVADLARMPHLLVAGATGAGKSVGLNSMIASILYKAAPDEVKMLMIDPKLLELSAYEGIPHLISPVITGPKPASEALKKMVFEMERRYRLIAEKGARNIDSYNKMAEKDAVLPYIVVIIDELADLMLSSAAEVEDSIARLAQMARASGIHLILATQRPSVDVITGVIKANFPTRIAFQVASRIDSRTILDAQGAEHLIGRGDMLLLMPGARVLRVHGAYLSEQEIKSLADFVRGQGVPDYGIMEAIAPPEKEESEPGRTERDELYEKAVDFCASTGEVSISSIQRRLKIGFNRAARIVELMEEDSLVGPPRAAGKPRQFLGRRSF